MHIVLLIELKQDKMMKHRGFTVIEFLVVLCILALLIGILLPALGAAKRAAQAAQAKNQQQQVEENDPDAGSSQFKITLYENGIEKDEWVTDPDTAETPVRLEADSASFYVDGLRKGFTIPEGGDMRYEYEELSRSEARWRE